MARTKMKPRDNDPIDARLLAADQERIGNEAEQTVAAHDERRLREARREIALERIAGDLPDDPKALWMYAEHSLAQSAVSMIDAGRALIKLKEVLPYGEFRVGLEERGIPKTTANNMMRIALKMSERSDKFLKLGRTKLYACLDFTDEELDALEAGGSVLDLTLDDLDRMTTRELKAAIKKRDGDIEVKDKLLAEKNARIDELATEVERLKGGIKRPEDDPRIQMIRGATMSAQAALVDLQSLANQTSDEELHVAGELYARIEELRSLFAVLRETALTRWPNLHMAMDDASDEPWRGQQVDLSVISGGKTKQ